MDADMIEKVRETLLKRVSYPESNTYNIVIPISKEGADRLLNALCGLLEKRDDYGTQEPDLKYRD